jgi:hypothetical protein
MRELVAGASMLVLFVRSSTDLRRGRRFRFHAVGCLLATPCAANTARLQIAFLCAVSDYALWRTVTTRFPCSG